MDRQLQWLSDLIGALGEPIAVHVAYVAPLARDVEVHRIIAHHGFGIDPLSVASDRRNRFEYPGFRALKALAERSAPNDLIYYCHSKGIVGCDETKMGLFRLHTEVCLTADLETLTSSPALNRAGLFPYRFGWCWYNFFWIKAGYMAGLTVEECDDRYRFEALIGEPGNKDAYRAVLPLIDRVPFADSGIVAKPWYWGEETTTPALTATYERYAEIVAYRAGGRAPGASRASRLIARLLARVKSTR